MTRRCHSVSERLSRAAISPARLSNRRKTVPLPTPAFWATASIVTESTPQCSTSPCAALSRTSRLRAASRRSGWSPSIGNKGRWLMTQVTLVRE